MQLKIRGDRNGNVRVLTDKDEEVEGLVGLDYTWHKGGMPVAIITIEARPVVLDVDGEKKEMRAPAPPPAAPAKPVQTTSLSGGAAASASN